MQPYCAKDESNACTGLEQSPAVMAMWEHHQKENGHQEQVRHEKHGMTEWLRLEGTTGAHLVQPPCLSRVPMSVELRIVSRQLWNVSR